VRYRKVTPPRGGDISPRNISRQDNSRQDTTRQNEETSTLSETLIMQGIISAIIMVFVLVVCLVDAPSTVTLRGTLQQMLIGHTTVDELMTEFQQFSEQWLGWEPFVPDLAPDTPTLNPVLDTELLPYAEPDYITDCLVAYDEELKSQVPEPPVTPGLWD